jgi:tRNA threonylcarbamoyladenosine biosynthesis protein TsaB
MILALDTSTDLCSVIVIANEKTKSKIKTHLKQIHAEKIVFMIEQVLGNINKQISDISSVAVSIGPGSFTGLRIGLSVAKGLCYAINKPLITVPTLDALALKAFDICKLLSKYERQNLYICPILNAKQNDFYYSIYKFESDKINRITEYQVGTIDEIKNKLVNKTILIGELVDNLVENFYNQDDVILLEGEINYPDAYYVAKIAKEKYAKGEFADLDSTEPLYIKEFVIKTK